MSTNQTVPAVPIVWHPRAGASAGESGCECAFPADRVEPAGGPQPQDQQQLHRAAVLLVARRAVCGVSAVGIVSAAAVCTPRNGGSVVPAGRVWARVRV